VSFLNFFGGGGTLKTKSSEFGPDSGGGATGVTHVPEYPGGGPTARPDSELGGRVGDSDRDSDRVR